ncbi:redoxin domain-containing protein [bacterium]|nr:redoxin domain-containing protein [bacterium]
MDDQIAQGVLKMSRAGWMLSIVGLCVGAFPQNGMAQVAPETLLRYTPKQSDVDYEIPKPAEVAQCKVEVERKGKTSGYVLLGPAGQVLRRFTDADGNGDVDQWSYFQHGIEVYREFDSNQNKKADQYRWLNLGGSRWGIDANEDGQIEAWKTLSAAEASRVAIQAMVTGDTALLQSLMITEAELRALGVNAGLAAKLVASATAAPGEVRSIVSQSKVLSPKSKWMRFDAQMPGIIPADEGKANGDLLVYENAMVVVEPGPALIQIGEMIRVGDVWKLTKAPTPIEGESVSITAGGLLMQPLMASAANDLVTAPSPEIQKLIEELQKLDQNQPQLGVAPAAQLAVFNQKRADLLMKLVSLAGSEDEKNQFLKQCVDGLAAAIQTDAYPEGLARLKQIEATLAAGGKRNPVLPFTIYRRVMSDYSVAMKSATEADQRSKVQESWLKSLEEFVADYPQAEDVGEALLQIAVAAEFSGKLDDAKSWYTKLAQGQPGTIQADKGRGAIRRLEMKGQPFSLAGSSLTGGQINTAAYRGKTLLVFYWATWCQPCQQDLPALRALYQQYQSRGFEVVGVCLDVPIGTQEQQVAQLKQYLNANKVPWPQMYEPGGLDSSPAVSYGIISLPTMFLIDDKGAVVSRNSSVEELKSVLPQLLSPKSAGRN